jgi:hypothetical protein
VGGFWRYCYHYSEPLGDDGIRYESEIWRAKRLDGKRKVLLTGSSQTREDFDMEYLNEAFEENGVAFYNLGLNGGAPPMDVMMTLDRIVTVNPDVVIYVPYVGSFYADYNYERLPYLSSIKIVPHVLRYLGVKEMYEQRQYFIESFLGDVLFFYRHRVSLLRILKNGIKNFLGTDTRVRPVRYAYRVNKPESFFVEKIEESQGNRFFVSRFTELNKALFILFAGRMKSEGIRLIVIDGPTHPLIKQTYKREFDIAYKKREFIDFTHLNELGRAKLSVFLKEYLEKNELY